MRLWRDDLSEVHRSIVAASFVTQLPTTPAPEEGLLGWMLRIAEKNGESGLGYLKRRIGDTRNGVEHLGMLVDAFATETGIEPAAVRCIAYLSEQGRREWCRAFHDQRMRRSALAFQTPKVCPACLKEGGPIRQIWDIRLLTDCARHRRPLITACPHCGTPIRWNRARARLCDRCGGDYAEAAHADSDVSVLPLVEDIEHVVAGNAPIRLPGFMEVVQPHLRVQALLESYLFLGRAVRHYWGLATPPVAISDVERSRDILRAAATVVDGTWEPFHRFLRAIYVPPTQTPEIGRIFPWFYRALFTRGRKYKDIAHYDMLAPVQRAFGRFLLDDHPELFQHLSGNILAIKNIAEGCGRVSLTAAAEELGSGKDTLLRVVVNLGVKVARVKWSKGTHYIRQNDFHRIRVEVLASPDLMYGPRVLERAATWIPIVRREQRLAEAGRTRHTGVKRAGSGTSRTILKQLAHVLAAIVEDRDFPCRELAPTLKKQLELPLMVLARRWNIAAATVRKLIRDGLFLSFEGHRVGARQFATVGAVAAIEREFSHRICATRRPSNALALLGRQGISRFHRRGISLADVLSAAASGELGPLYLVGRRRGLCRLAVPLVALDAWAAARFNTRYPGLVDARSAGKILGITVRDLRDLGRRGHLSRTVVGANVHLYDPADLERFAREFVRTNEICSRRMVPGIGRRRSWVQGRLRERGVVPAIGPDVDGCAIVFYRRSDIEDAARRARQRLPVPA